ncbi:hypothetical protein [Bacillus sp. FJAT-44742]|uniref:hypothetical protein n=1 Tax=Bacillus sp. FJAT-44742 TaxID=2014005 RepID=UPI000C24A45A|nr:hypothetical protein [Bacillus sp. FJAT-44742]
MVVNILFGFLLPWVFGCYLYHKDKYLMVTTIPLCVLIAFVINTKGSRYWLLKPRIKEKQYRTIYPLNLGYFPVVASFMIYFAQKRIWPRMIWITLFTLLSATAEIAALLAGKLLYKNGWNIYKTLLTYFLPYCFVVLYYDFVKMLRVLTQQSQQTKKNVRECEENTGSKGAYF